MEEMMNNKNIRKEIEKRASEIAEEEKERYMREMADLKAQAEVEEESSEEEDEQIGPSVDFKEQENSDEVFK